jgi:hypothetical protein
VTDVAFLYTSSFEKQKIPATPYYGDVTSLRGSPYYGDVTSLRGSAYYS